MGGSLGPLCPVESEFLGWSSERAFVANFPDAYSACRAMDLIHFLSFPDGETEAHRGEGTYPQSQGCGMARPGLLMLPAGVFFRISPCFLECGIFHRDPDPVSWYEISETRVFHQKFRPSPLYWKKGILWSRGFAVPPPLYPGPLHVLFLPSGGQQGTGVACLSTDVSADLSQVGLPARRRTQTGVWRSCLGARGTQGGTDPDWSERAETFLPPPPRSQAPSQLCSSELVTGALLSASPLSGLGGSQRRVLV